MKTETKAAAKYQDHNAWLAQYSKLSAIAQRIGKMRHERAKKLCKEAGLDPDLLGIHPHNAMCGFNNGKPWPGVNYSKVRACLRELDRQFDGSRLVTKWDKRVRVYA